MNTLAAEVRQMIQDAPKKKTGYFDINRYIGTSHEYVGLSNPAKYDLVRTFKKNHPDITFDELIAMMNDLNQGKTFEEKTMGSFIMFAYPKYNLQFTANHFAKWLSNLEGWCEVDSLCQSTFDAAVLLENWRMWQKGLRAFAHDKYITKRRASLVLLCKAARTTEDTRIRDLAFENIEVLKHEKDILITKAISWLLRDMIKNFKPEVSEYLQKNESTLPKIAVRETKKKIETGKKTS